MISSMADDSPPPSLTSESQPDGFRTASVRPECHPLYPSPSSSESMLASKAFLPLPTLPPPTPVLDHILDSLCPGTSVPSRPLLAPCPTGCWACTQSHRAGVHATVAGDMLLLLAEGLAPLPTGQGQEWWPPRHPKEGQTKGSKPKTEESHPGCRRRAEAPQGRAMGFTL